MFEISICLYHVGIYLIPSKYEISGLTRFLLEFFFLVYCVYVKLNFGLHSTDVLEQFVPQQRSSVSGNLLLSQPINPSAELSSPQTTLPYQLVSSATLLWLHSIPSSTPLIKIFLKPVLCNKILEGPLVTSCQPDLIP